MMTRLARPLLIALGLTLGLTACGNNPVKSPLVIAGGSLLGVVRPGQPVPDARQVLSPQLIAASPVSALLVIQKTADSGFTVIPVASNRGTVQWAAGDDRGLLRRDGVLVGTRGYGFDLMTADIAPLVAAFAAGGGSDVQRVNRYLTGEGLIETRDYLCDVRLIGNETLDIYGKRHATRVFEEDCRATGGDFVNRYWVESNGTVRKSIERISPEVGDFEIIRLTE
ncbi:YjbF family lipoprotein [Jannaschia pohangensis]|uniref:Group 4 capsule polysaccharide lipoprotein gfcB, YjbF n=1 Tax=Jannaschia pohangensis TaxID=390807 RepID=A0A1I3UC16_9RHOB|nr:YjbF family lipoprotein [Jannaschia pohangensis]SFJ79341.1 Group 4 capsule polysaccharide lipoprotein gfcB, YjbF [Jannaschia pohangensis]